MVRVRRTQPRRWPGRLVGSVAAALIAVSTLAAPGRVAGAQDPLDDVIGCDLAVALRYLDQQGIGHDTAGTGRVVAVDRGFVGVPALASPSAGPDDEVVPGVSDAPSDTTGPALPGETSEPSQPEAPDDELPAEPVPLVRAEPAASTSDESCALADVPDLVGLTVARARARADDAGLVTEWDHIDPTWIVQGQEPAASLVAPRDTAIEVEVVPPPVGGSGSDVTDDPVAGAGVATALTRPPDPDEDTDVWTWVVLVVAALLVAVALGRRARRRARRRPRVVLRPGPATPEVHERSLGPLALSARADPPTRTVVEARP